MLGPGGASQRNNARNGGALGQSVTAGVTPRFRGKLRAVRSISRKREGDNHGASVAVSRSHVLAFVVVALIAAGCASGGNRGAGNDALRKAPKAKELPWTTAAREAAEAYDANELDAYRVALLKLYVLFSGHPDVVFKLAVAEARLGNLDASLDWLRVYAGMGLTRDVAVDPDLAPVRDGKPDAFLAVATRLEDNAHAVSRSEAAFTLPSQELLAEDVAYDDESRTFYVSSVRKRKIVSASASGKIEDFVRDGQDGTWSIFGLAVDTRRHLLWAATAAVPQAANYSSGDAGKTALVAYDLHTRKLVRRIELRVDAPPPARHGLTGLTLTHAGGVIVSDTSAGTLYELGQGSATLETLVGSGTFVSPRTPAVTPDDTRVVVADYVRGIAVVDRASKKTTWLTHPRDVALSGIDGLYFAGPSILLGVQNGTSPVRIVRLYLDDALTRVERLEVAEQETPGLGMPARGVVVSSMFFFVASSGWDQLEDDGSVKPGGMRVAPAIWRLPALGGNEARPRGP